MVLRGRCFCRCKSAAYLSKLLASLCFALSGQAFAANLPQVCHMDNGQKADVVAITDFLELKLAQGKLVRLADIDFPGGREAARRHLSRTLVGKPITIHEVSEGRDRWRRGAAHVATDKAGSWLQNDLIERGLARVRPQFATKACLQPLLESETRARWQKRGLWRSDEFRRIAVEGTRNRGYVHNQYAVFIGRIVSVGETDRWRYFNFGRNWKTDFTVRINRRSKNVIGPIETDPDMVAGNVVEVRGIVRDYDGGQVDIVHPAQLQIVKRREQNW